jgi:hypothetical protein
MKLAMFDNIHHCHANDQLHNILYGETLARTLQRVRRSHQSVA